MKQVFFTPPTLLNNIFIISIIIIGDLIQWRCFIQPIMLKTNYDFNSYYWGGLLYFQQNVIWFSLDICSNEKAVFPNFCFPNSAGRRKMWLSILRVIVFYNPWLPLSPSASIWIASKVNLNLNRNLNLNKIKFCTHVYCVSSNCIFKKLPKKQNKKLG